MSKAGLPNDVKQLMQIFFRQQSCLDYLEEQLRLAQQKQFGASSES
jgi:transposase